MVYVFHECKCWILIRAGIGNPMFLFRKGNPFEHKKHCQAATKSGNQFFELTNCDGHQITTGISGNAEIQWVKMFSYNPRYRFPKLAHYSNVEYFRTGNSKDLNSFNKI